jgi:malonyl-ACP decarboxylase
MPGSRPDPAAPVVTGIGVAAGLGYGKDALRASLFDRPDLFGVMRRPGRQGPDGDTAFIGVELPEPPELLPRRTARTASLSARVAIAVLDEAWREARLEAVDPARIGLVIGGSGLSSREQLLAQQAYAGRLSYWPPRHGYMFLDTDLCGLCAATYGIRGFAYTVGGASASGAIAVLHAAQAVQAGQVDACIALGALQDISYFDCQGFTAIGAMGSARFADRPALACRPFDRDRDGFIFGESCAALVVQKAEGVAAGRSYGAIAGWAQVADGNRGPEPSLAGEAQAIRAALARAGLQVADVDYVNAHATGTPLGDDTELAAYREVGLQHAWINATKSAIGHGLGAAGAVELAAVLLQMRDGRLHATRNLEAPLDAGFRWVAGRPLAHRVRTALKLSFGFGGIDTALVVRDPAAA